VNKPDGLFPSRFRWRLGEFSDDDRIHGMYFFFDLVTDVCIPLHTPPVVTSLRSSGNIMGIMWVVRVSGGSGLCVVVYRCVIQMDIHRFTCFLLFGISTYPSIHDTVPRVAETWISRPPWPLGAYHVRFLEVTLGFRMRTCKVVLVLRNSRLESIGDTRTHFIARGVYISSAV